MAIGKLISAEALISTKTISIPTTKPTTIQSTPKDKVHINKIETTPITGNRQREDHKSKIFPSDARANPRLAHVAMQISSTTKKKSRMKIIALHDSGCAKSVIKTSKFEELLTHGHI